MIFKLKLHYFIMEKKAQVTIFVIIGILIVASVSIYFFVFNKDNKNNEIPSSVAPIYEFVKSCIENNLEETVYIMGQGGGYYFPPTLSNTGGFTYYFYEGKNYFLTKSEIEKSISSAVEADILVCVDGFSKFKDYEINEGRISVETTIENEKIIFNVNYPLSIKKAEEINVLNDFGEYSVNVRFGLIHSLIDELIRKNYYSKNSICIDCLTDLVFENNLDLDFLEGGNDNSIFIIKDYNEETNKTFEYIFAA